MAVSVVMPALEMAQETGKLVRWLKNEGEPVKKGEMLLEVETDKAVVEIEAQGDGILAGVTAKVDDVIPVGQTIAWLVKPGEQPPSASAPTQTGRKMDAAPAAAAAASASAAPEPASVAGARISPKARRLAREHGVDIATVKGSGPGGEILADDILKAARGPVEAPTRRKTDTDPAIIRHGIGPSPGVLNRSARLQPGLACRHRRGDIHRPHHGRADDAKLDDRSALLRDARSRCDGAHCGS
jgi:pyruvate dehydrogenase E2 component (dihydrolipoamide acetyltransferase)